MCGIAGFWSRIDADTAIGDTMAEAISSRGPDDVGVWSDMGGPVLAHRRLSIIDLSDAGHQPMHSRCMRYTIVFNGEIYNHLELRSQLMRDGISHNWLGQSDTESLLVAISHWGIQETILRLNGMFAFALWDKALNKLYLARDRLGEKPLYYGYINNTFVFGSELKAIMAHPSVSPVLSRSSLALFFRYGYVPSPYSIFKGINKLPQASIIEVRDYGSKISEPNCYWKLSSIIADNINPGGEYESLVNELESLLKNSVMLRMAADVPVGAFLSGGYDSTLITSLMQQISGEPIKTYSIGFHEANYNEAEHAKEIARYLGTDHTELYVTSSDAFDTIPELPKVYDEPFADSSQIPTLLVSKLASRNVSVCLSGDGADELFCGYNRHVFGPQIWNAVGWMPHVVKTFLANSVSNVGARSSNAILSPIFARSGVSKLPQKLEKLAKALESTTDLSFYHALISHTSLPEALITDCMAPDVPLSRDLELLDMLDFREKMMLLDQCGYLSDDILTKVDRATMSVGLEARVPFLDHRLVEFSWRIPTAFKYRNGRGKHILREVLYRSIPRKMVDRPKMGFGVPLGDWLTGPLRPWAEELLSEEKLRRQGVLNTRLVRQRWSEQLSGEGQWQHLIWNILVFQQWSEYWKVV